MVILHAWIRNKIPIPKGRSTKMRFTMTSCAMSSLPSAACSNSKNNCPSCYSSASLLEKLSETLSVPSSFQSVRRPSQHVGAEFPTERTAFLLVVSQCFQRNCVCQTRTAQHGSMALGNTWGSATENQQCSWRTIPKGLYFCTYHCVNWNFHFVNSPQRKRNSCLP